MCCNTGALQSQPHPGPSRPLQKMDPNSSLIQPRTAAPAPPPPLPQKRGKVDLKVPGPKPPRQAGAAFDPRLNAWTFPFMGEPGPGPLVWPGVGLYADSCRPHDYTRPGSPACLAVRRAGSFVQTLARRLVFSCPPSPAPCHPPTTRTHTLCRLAPLARRRGGRLCHPAHHAGGGEGWGARRQRVGRLHPPLQVVHDPVSWPYRHMGRGTALLGCARDGWRQMAAAAVGWPLSQPSERTPDACQVLEAACPALLLPLQLAGLWCRIPVPCRAALGP